MRILRKRNYHFALRDCQAFVAAACEFGAAINCDDALWLELLLHHICPTSNRQGRRGVRSDTEQHEWNIARAFDACAALPQLVGLLWSGVDAVDDALRQRRCNGMIVAT